MENKKKKKRGVFLPEEVLQDNRLDWFERALFSLYLYYTEYGDDHCCHMTYAMINEMFGGEITESRYHRAKRKLKELGLIVTDGGITTKAVMWGVTSDTGGVSSATPIKKN